MPVRPLFYARETGSRRVMRRSTCLVAALLLAACGQEAAVPTTEENAQMDDAANLLDRAPEDLEAVDDGELNAADSNRLH